VTRPGVLYRSEAPRPGDLAPSGVPVWPPRTVVDLRSAVERGTGAHPLAADGSEVHVLPLLGDDISEPAGAERTQAAIAGGLQTLYPAILEFAALGLVEILRLAAGEPGPLLVHCSAGKDRTGLAFVLLLRAADVTPDAVLADYLATGPNMPGVLRRLRHTSVLPGSLAPARAGREAAIRDELAAVSITAATAVLTLLDGYPGGARGWFADHGADAATLEAWRERFVQTA
jgi:hypothetical protein